MTTMTTPTRLDRYNLMCFHDATGQVKPVRNLDDWQRRREEILRGFESVAGPLPGDEKRCPLDVKIEREVTHEGDNYTERLITYAAEPGSRVPAYLLIPKKALAGETCPGVLSILGTGMNRSAFSEENLASIGLPRWNEQRDYTREVAARGYVTITPGYPFLGKHEPDLKALGYESTVMKAVWDAKRAMDVLDSLPFVRHGRYGGIGHSLGGFLPMVTSVFDQRLAAIVSSGGWGPLVDYQNGDITSWSSIYYFQKLKGVRNVDTPFDFTELTGCIAPRPVYINMPTEDPYHHWEHTAKLVKAATPIWELHRAQPPIVEHPVAKHDFPDDIRRRAYVFLDSHLGRT